MELRRSSHYDGLKNKFEGDIKSIFQKFQNNFGNLEVKYKIVLRIFLFFASGTQTIWCVVHSVYYKFKKKRKIIKFI